MKGIASRKKSKRQFGNDCVCPLCGDEGFNTDTFWCKKCDGFIVDCPICASIVFFDNKYHPCRCVVGIYSYGSQEFRQERKEFIEWRRRHLRSGKESQDELDYDDPANDPYKVKELAKITPWLEVVFVGDDGAFGHSSPDIYFFVRPDELSKLAS